MGPNHLMEPLVSRKPDGSDSNERSVSDSLRLSECHILDVLVSTVSKVSLLTFWKKVIRRAPHSRAEFRARTMEVVGQETDTQKEAPP